MQAADLEVSRPRYLQERQVALWACLVSYLIIAAPIVYWLWQRWTMSIWHNGHGIFVPFLVAFLTWETLRDDPAKDEKASSAWGFAFLGPAMLLIILDSAADTQILSALALVLSLPGLSLLLLGARRAKALAFPCILALFMLPIPAAFIDPLILKLRIISSIGSEKLVELSGIPVIREGTTLLLPDAAVAIADACSGFSTLYASLTFALLFAHMSSSPARKLILVLAAAPVAIAANILRCAWLVLLVHSYGSEILETPLHVGSGFVSFLTALGILALLARWESPRRLTRS